jgi:hypothetical protein
MLLFCYIYKLEGTVTEQAHEEGREHKKLYAFFVDAKRYETEKESLNGAEIKTIAVITPTYQLFEEEEGDHPDKPITDSEAVHMPGKIKHFYAVPPATFGK